MCLKSIMTMERFKEVQIECIYLIFKFLQERIQECPVFMHILDIPFNQIFLQPSKFVKNEAHDQCCMRVFLDKDLEEKTEYEEVFCTHADKEKLCSCTCLDLCLQTNNVLDEKTKKLIFDFFFQMFQSYHFK